MAPSESDLIVLFLGFFLGVFFSLLAQIFVGLIVYFLSEGIHCLIVFVVLILNSGFRCYQPHIKFPIRLSLNGFSSHWSKLFFLEDCIIYFVVWKVKNGSKETS